MNNYVTRNKVSFLSLFLICLALISFSYRTYGTTLKGVMRRSHALVGKFLTIKHDASSKVVLT